MGASTYKKAKAQKQPNKKPNHRQSGKDKLIKTQSEGENKVAGCWNCGFESRHSRLEGPAKEQKRCNKCSKHGHCARVCNYKSSAKKPQTGCITLETSPSSRVAGIEESDFIEATIQPGKSKKDTVISILQDTGGKMDAILVYLYRSDFSDTFLITGGSNAITATGSHLPCTLRCKVLWLKSNANQSIKTTFHILQDLKQPVHSKATQKALRMLPAGYPHESISKLEKNEPQDDLVPTLFQQLMATVGINPTDKKKKEDLRKLIAEFMRIFDGIC